MDVHFKRIFDELKQMELRLSDRIEGRCSGLERCVEEPIFDAELAVDEDPVYDEDPIFYEEPVFDMEPVFDLEPRDPTTACISAIFNEESGDLTTTCIGVDFNKDPFLDEGPLFDEEPFDDKPNLDINSAAATALDIDIESSNFNSGAPTNCLTKFPNLMVIITAPVPVCTVTGEAILELDLAAVTHMAMAAVPSNVNTGTSSTCLTECPSCIVSIRAPAPMYDVAEGVIVLLDQAPALSTTSVPVVLEPSSDVSAVHSWLFSLDWVDPQPWPPPLQLRSSHYGVVQRPMPWPSYNTDDKVTGWWYVGLLRKPPRLLQVQLGIMDDPRLGIRWNKGMVSPMQIGILETLQYPKQRKCGGVSELAGRKWISVVLEECLHIAWSRRVIVSLGSVAVIVLADQCTTALVTMHELLSNMNCLDEYQCRIVTILIRVFSTLESCLHTAVRINSLLGSRKSTTVVMVYGMTEQQSCHTDSILLIEQTGTLAMVQVQQDYVEDHSLRDICLLLKKMQWHRLYGGSFYQGNRGIVVFANRLGSGGFVVLEFSADIAIVGARGHKYERNILSFSFDTEVVEYQDYIPLKQPWPPIVAHIQAGGVREATTSRDVMSSFEAEYCTINWDSGGAILCPLEGKSDIKEGGMLGYIIDTMGRWSRPAQVHGCGHLTIQKDQPPADEGRNKKIHRIAIRLIPFLLFFFFLLKPLALLFLLIPHLFFL